MVLSKTILILEDNLLEQDQPYDFSVIVLTNHRQVAEYVNNNPKATFDIILLDRDCKLNESFHILDVERFDPEKVISISSVPKYNVEARRRGVKRVVLKDYKALDAFVDCVVKEVERMISPPRLLGFG